MRKLLTILLLIFLLTVSASGQWPYGNKPMLGHQIDRIHPLGTSGGLVGYWPFNEGSGNIAQDLSGNNISLDFFNAPVWSSGKFGSSILFNDGSTQYLSRSSAIVIAPPFTVVAWFNTDDSTVNQAIFSITDTTANFDGHMLIILDDPDNTLRADSQKDGTASAVTTNTYTVGKWHQAVGIWRTPTDREAVLDADFSNKGTNTTSKSPVGLDTTSIGVFKKSTLYFYFSGQIDHVLFYNRALSAGEIALLYQEPFCMIEKDNLALMVETAPPAPGAGQVIFINMSGITILFALVLLRKKWR